MKRAAFALVLAACQDSTVSRELGAECTSNKECDDVCAVGPGFPDGMCTLSCMIDADCPSEAKCTTAIGGICVYRCTADAECRFLGPMYACVGNEGEVNTCRGG